MSPHPPVFHQCFTATFWDKVQLLEISASAMVISLPNINIFEFIAIWSSVMSFWWKIHSYVSLPEARWGNHDGKSMVNTFLLDIFCHLWSCSPVSSPIYTFFRRFPPAKNPSRVTPWPLAQRQIADLGVVAVHQMGDGFHHAVALVVLRWRRRPMGHGDVMRIPIGDFSYADWVGYNMI